MRTWPSCEIDVGEALAPILVKRGFKLYPEVVLPSAIDARGEQIIPDLIGVCEREGLCEVFELKTSVSLDLVADAQRWTAVFNRSWGVAPMVLKERRRSGGFIEACRAFKRAGAGLILVDERGCWERVVTPRFTPTHKLVHLGIGEALQGAGPGKVKAGSPGRVRRETPRAAANASLREALLELLARRPKISAARAFREIGAGMPFIIAAKSGSIEGVRVERGRLVVEDLAAGSEERATA
jgi:hypothetical protein